MEPVIIKIGNVFHKHHFSNTEDCFTLTIGRAFSNDVIIADPYIGPSQIEIHISVGAPGVFRKGLFTSTIFFGVIALLVCQNKDEYSNQPVHSVMIKPSYIPTTTALRIEKYIDNYNVLFDRLSSAE